MAWPFQIEWGTCGANAAQSLPAAHQHKFDLASLTKVIATSTLLIDHYLSTQKSWESWLKEPVSTTITELRNSPWETTTLREFWEHRSGMAAHILLRGPRGQSVPSGAQRLTAQAEALAALLKLPKSTYQKTVYSDLGFFILGLYLERSADASQSELWQAWRMDHLGVTSQLKYFAELTPAERAVVLPTESDRHAAGSVNDDNAFNLGEQAAHAGLTGRVADVVDWMQTLAAWQSEEPRLKPWLQQGPVDSQRFIYGWDTPTPATPGGNSQGGRSAPPLTRGHLGYTGTALWMDPMSTTGGVLLTNRVYPLHSPDSQQIIRELRTEFFTALWQNKDLGRDEWLQIVQKKIRLNKGDWVHLIAIGGTGMGSLAALLQDLGCVVTGSDGPLYPPMSTFLQTRKITAQVGYNPGHLTNASGQIPALVIIGNAISRGNAEAAKAEELKISKKLTIMSFPEALAEFAIGERKSFVVCGTHGKTTTTTFFAWALEELGCQPGFLIGGIPKNFSSGCRVSEGNYFVSEGDEYDTAYWDKESKFLHYRPSWVLCTGIEYDHADIYSNLSAIVASFEKLVTKTRIGWALIDAVSAPKASPVDDVARALGAQGLKFVRYGKATDSEFCLLEASPHPLPWRNDVNGERLRVRTEMFGEITLYSPMSGLHNALNVLGVFATLVASGELKSVEKFQQILQGFGGVRRRQDEVAVGPHTTVVDDFAHHPTAIRETIAGIRGRYPQAKLAAFFEARSATSARNVFLKEFSECFDLADAVFLSPPSKTNIPEAEKLDVPKLLENIQARLKGKPVVLEKEVSDLAERFQTWRAQEMASGSTRFVALVMSNGPFGGIHRLLEDR